MDNKAAYHRWIQTKNPVDGLPEEVCHDLNVDELFEGVDYTASYVGKQYLYHLLCTDGVSEVAAYEKVIGWLAEKKELRDKCLDVLKPLGNPDASGIVDLLAEDEHVYSSRYLFLLQVCRWLPLLFAGMMLIFPSSPIPFILLLVAYIGNAVIHFREKNKLLGYFFSIPLLRNLLVVTEKLSAEKVFVGIDESIPSVVSRLAGLKRRLDIFRFGLKLEGDGAMLAYLFTEFFHIFFLSATVNVIASFRALADKREDIAREFRFVGLLDTLYGVACLRNELPYWCHPSSTSAEGIRVEDICHPLITGCVANSLSLSNKSMLLTGSNMSGKTSFIRTIAVNLIMAKAMNTCYARRFEMDLSLRLYSVIHTEDNLLEGKSYFFKEAENVKRALKKGMQGGYLLVFDELFKGTNTVERIAVNASVFASLAARGNWVLASTHDLKLADLLEEDFELYHFCETVEGGRLSFDYKLKPGLVREGNAIKILQLCGYPELIVNKALQISGSLL